MMLVINAKYIGNGVTKKQAKRMVALLREYGYDVHYGRKASTYDEIAKVIEGIDWVLAWDEVAVETDEGIL